jgi:hypothetical protein
MLALSDAQDLTSLDLGKVDLECARHILKIVKAVKRQPVAFLRLLTDIINISGGFPPMDLALILESVNQAMRFPDEESTTSLLLPPASSIEWHRGWVVQVYRFSQDQLDIVFPEAQRICGLLRARYAAGLISSPAQLRLLSCARSAAVAQPAMGRLRLYESL